MHNNVLCILRNHLFEKGIDDKKDKLIVVPRVSDVLGITTHFVDRSHCDNGKRYLQLFPYITVVDKSTRKILCVREKDKRRKNTHSIGIGGSISIQESESLTIRDVITEEALRYLSEETPIGITKLIYDKVKSFIDSDNFGVIYNNEVKYERSKLCLSVILPIIKDDYEIFRESNSFFNWYSTKDLIDNHNSGEIVLDEWSKTVTFVITGDIQA